MNPSSEKTKLLRIEPSLNKRHNFPYAEWGCLLLVSVLIVARQFTNPHFPSCVIDDSILQMSWVRQFVQVLSEGVWLPRWLPDSNGGYGSPTFIFYSPLVYYVTALLYSVTKSVVLSMKLVRFLGFFLSGLAMFAYAKSLTSRKLALLVSLVYLVIPFHVLDISYWTLYAEPWAWIWFPLILFFLRHLFVCGVRTTSHLMGLSLSYSGLVLTHLVSAYMFSLVMVGYLLFCSNRVRILENSKWLLVGMATALALAAFFLLPVLYERRFIHLEYSTMLPEFDFRNTFLFFPNPDLTGGNVFQAKTIGILQAITVLQVAWTVVSAGVTLHTKTLSQDLRKELFVLNLLSLFCLFLMSRPSVWIWRLIPGLPQIQFSTRWLSIYTLLATVVIGISFESYHHRLAGLAKWLKMSHFSVAFLAGLGSVLIILGGCFLNEEHTRAAEADLYSAPEYNPRSMPNWKQRIIHAKDPAFAIMEGKADIKIKRWASHERNLRIEADTPIRLKLRLHEYPGWIVTIDDQRTPISTDPASGGIVVNVPQGQHVVRVSFENTWWRNAALGLSGLTALGMLSFTLKEFLWR